MKKKLSLIGIILILLLVAIFSISNMQRVSVNFLITKVQIPLVVLIILSILVGVIIAILLSASSSFKHKKQIKDLNHQVKSLQTKVDRDSKNKEEC